MYRMLHYELTQKHSGRGKSHAGGPRCLMPFKKKKKKEIRIDCQIFYGGIVAIDLIA